MRRSFIFFWWLLLYADLLHPRLRLCTSGKSTRPPTHPPTPLTHLTRCDSTQANPSQRSPIQRNSNASSIFRVSSGHAPPPPPTYSLST